MAHGPIQNFATINGKPRSLTPRPKLFRKACAAANSEVLQLRAAARNKRVGNWLALKRARAMAMCFSKRRYDFLELLWIPTNDSLHSHGITPGAFELTEVEKNEAARRGFPAFLKVRGTLGGTRTEESNQAVVSSHGRRKERGEGKTSPSPRG